MANTIMRLRIYENTQKQAMFDDLTGLYTRRYFFESSHRAYNKAKRFKEVFSVILIDIDFFKRLNDSYGHSLGDNVLKQVANILSAGVRDGDIVCQVWGGRVCNILAKH